MEEEMETISGRWSEMDLVREETKEFGNIESHARLKKDTV